MGAFVGRVTSPFLRRRKGRVGRDVIQTLVAPTFGGQPLYGGAGNYQTSMCAVTGTTHDYQTGDFGQSAWIPRTYLDPLIQTGGSAAPEESPIKMRPWYANMDPDLWAIQNHFSVACRFTGVGGALLQISPDGRQNKVNFTAPTFFRTMAWSADGKCYFAAGEMIGASVLGRGNQGDTADAPIVFNYSLPAAGGLGCSGIMAFNHPSPRFKYWFITWNAQGAVPKILKIILMQHDGTWTNSGDITCPLQETGGNFLQWRDKLVGFSSASPNMIQANITGSPNIFFDAGWTVVNTGNGGPIEASFAFGKRFYALSETFPKVRRSFDAGLTWENGVDLPHANAKPTSVCLNDLTGEVFILASDLISGVNRFYRYRPFLEI